MAKAKPVSKSDPVAQMAKLLAHVLSDTYVLAVKTHGYHWNVMGPMFPQLHEFFGKQYEDLFEAADDIAERIRALGMMPDGSMDSFLQNTVIKEAGTKPMTAEAMLEDLLKSYEAMRERLIAAEDYADDIDDVATQDLMVERIRAQDKTMWMIRAQV